MRKHILSGLGLVTTAFLLASCGGNSSVADKVASAASAVEEASSNGFLSNKEKLAKAEAELRDMPKFKGKKVNVFQDVHFYGDGRIMIELQDPDKPANIDHYEYKDGKWGEPQPVQISGEGEMSANMTPLDDVKFEVVSTVYANWNEKAKTVEGATDKPLDHIYFTLWVPNQQRYWNSSSVEGTREKYNIEFNLDGSVKEFKKS